MKTILLTLGAMTLGSAAMAQGGAQTEPPTAPAAKPAVPAKNPDPIVCHTEDVVGSRLKKQKMCMTVSQWRDVSRQSGEWLDHRTDTKGGLGGG